MILIYYTCYVILNIDYNFSTGPISPMEARPIERAIEARPVDDALGSMVRCLSFTKTFIVTGIFNI